MSAHSASQRGGWLSALVAQVSEFVFEEAEETVEPAPAELKPHPVVAVVAAAPRSGATTVTRLLAAELATRAEGAASVVASGATRRSAPPSRAAIRLATGLTAVGNTHPIGRLCIVAPPAQQRDPAAVPFSGEAGRSEAASTVSLGVEGSESGSAFYAERVAGVVSAARYLAPVVLDLPADGSAAGIAAIADRIVVIAAASGEPALLDAVAGVVGGRVIKVVNRSADAEPWADRAELILPDSRLGARAATVGTRALGGLGSGIGALADALEVGQ